MLFGGPFKGDRWCLHISVEVFAYVSGFASSIAFEALVAVVLERRWLEL